MAGLIRDVRIFWRNLRRAPGFTLMAATHLIRGLLFGVESNDPAAYAITIGILLAVAMSACFFPALRAARVDPVIALRDE